MCVLLLNCLICILFTLNKLTLPHFFSSPLLLILIIYAGNVNIATLWTSIPFLCITNGTNTMCV